MATTISLDICWPCVTAMEAATRVARIAAASPKPVDESAIEHWRAICARAVESALRIEDPIERLLLACRYWIEDSSGTGLAVSQSFHMGTGNGMPAIRPVYAALFSSTFPGLWRSSEAVILSSSSPPWDSNDVAAWFALRARRQGITVPRVKGSREKGFFAGEIKGWLFRGTEWFVSSNGESRGFNRVIVDSRGKLRPPTGELHATSLADMAKFLGLEKPEMLVPSMPR